MAMHVEQLVIMEWYGIKIHILANVPNTPIPLHHLLMPDVYLVDQPLLTQQWLNADAMLLFRSILMDTPAFLVQVVCN